MNYFKTSDFPLSVTIVSLGHKVHHIERNNSKRAQFCFEHNHKLDEVVDAFWREELQVEPKRFCATQKMLKSQLYSQS